MAKGYQLIQAQTLTSSAASVTFSNIPQNYSDLILKISARTNYSAVNDYIYMSLNGNTSLNSYNMIYGDGSSTAGYNGSGATNATGISTANGATSTANTFCNSEIYIPNYAGSTAKSASVDTVIENNAAGTVMELLSYLNTGTSAITTIALTPGNGPNFVANSTFVLYGVGGTRATGGTITSDFNYTYHTFTSTSTFTANEKIKGAEILLVAGGGGGGTDISGGGGAGGVLSYTGETLFAGTSYTVLVGAGGATQTTSSTNGNNGGSSSFGSKTTTGGGGGGHNDTAGSGGGSGGGAGRGSNGAVAAGSGTSGQGYAGGAVTFINAGTSGGGGGAGAVGASPTGTSPNGVSGAGGIGTIAYTDWLYATSSGVLSNGTYYIAGGGGGGSYSGFASIGSAAGGLGGGGTGSPLPQYSAGSAATANTGGGGGGGGGSGGGAGSGGAGGSGLVIIRYPSN